MSSLCLFSDPSGRLLIVKPTYKSGWSMVGGNVDDHESPLGAMVRETKEEIGLALLPERFSFLLLKYNAPNDGFTDSLTIMFTARLTDAETRTIKLQADELEELRWVDDGEADALGLRDSMTAGLAAMSKGTGYAEGPDIVIPGHLPLEESTNQESLT